MGETQYELRMTRGPDVGFTLALSDKNLTIGRDRMSDIFIKHPEISRQHALIIARFPGEYLIQDLGSTNGTFVDGQRLINIPIKLRPMQTIALGSAVTFVVQERIHHGEEVGDLREEQPSQGDEESEDEQVEDRQQVERPESTRVLPAKERLPESQRPIRSQPSSLTAADNQTGEVAQVTQPPSSRLGPNTVLGLVLLLLCCSLTFFLFLLLVGGDWLFRLAGLVP